MSQNASDEYTSVAQVLATALSKQLRSATRTDGVKVRGARSFEVDEFGWISPRGELAITTESDFGLATLEAPTIRLAVLAHQTSDAQLLADLAADLMPTAYLAGQLATSTVCIHAALAHLLEGLSYDQSAQQHLTYKASRARADVQRTADRLRERWDQAYSWLSVHGTHNEERTRRQRYLSWLTASTFSDILYGLSESLNATGDMRMIAVNGHTAVISERSAGTMAPGVVQRAAHDAAAALPTATVNMTVSRQGRWPAGRVSQVTLFSRRPENHDGSD